MNIQNAVATLNQQMAGGVDVYERRPGQHQLVVPILHEDGDMLDIYLQTSPLGDGYIRICDFGMTLMRLSYTFDETSLARMRILDSILINNDIRNDAGNLYLDAPADSLYRGVLQFAGCVQKVCNMRYWTREVPRNSFYDDLGEYITTELAPLSPIADVFPLPDYPVGVGLVSDAQRACVLSFRRARQRQSEERGNLPAGVPKGEAPLHQLDRA